MQWSFPTTVEDELISALPLSTHSAVEMLHDSALYKFMIDIDTVCDAVLTVIVRHDRRRIYTGATCWQNTSSCMLIYYIIILCLYSNVLFTVFVRLWVYFADFWMVFSISHARHYSFSYFFITFYFLVACASLPSVSKRVLNIFLFVVFTVYASAHGVFLCFVRSTLRFTFYSQ